MKRFIPTDTSIKWTFVLKTASCWSIFCEAGHTKVNVLFKDVTILNQTKTHHVLSLDYRLCLTILNLVTKAKENGDECNSVLLSYAHIFC